MFRNHRWLSVETLESRRMLTVAVEIPGDLTGEPGGQVLAPVNIDDAVDIRAAEIRINYDTGLLDAEEAGVTAGSVWPSEGTVVTANVNDAAGTIVVFLSTAEGLDSVSGSLLQIQFTIDGSAPVDGTTDVDLALVELNEGAIEPDPDPQPGEDSTDGLITFVPVEDTAVVSGFIYADTNSNDQPDPFEGIPGVTVVLIPEGGGDQQEAITGDDGQYEFTELAAGSYLVQQQQPAAYLDGGPNEISVELEHEQILTDQNFREIGLRPEFVYNRLFTTIVMPVGSTEWVSAISQIGVDADGDEPETLAGLTQAAQAGGPVETPESEGPGETAPAAIIPEAEGTEPPPTEPESEAESGNADDGGALTQAIVSLAPQPEGEGLAVAPQLVGLIPEQEGGGGTELAAPPIVSLVPEAEGLGSGDNAPVDDPVSAIVSVGIDVSNSPASAVVETYQTTNSPAPTAPAMATVDQVMADAESGVGQESDLHELAAESPVDSTDPVDFDPVDLAFETLDLSLLDA